ncbi:DUF6120 family protein [Ruminococcus sp.]|uniref:DUF6120 family protein n=1 Tax=Ruminococcus sp. TaxID=41978 RepID=UPI002BF0A62D|nr:DUF6120 family protein [Ruminococcus sp.]HOH88412.1 DUF6120 family protein [Ruminococcus sp.]
MKITNKERNQYINQIKKLLFCSSKERKKFLKEFNDNIDDFLKDNPEASIDELQKAMGTPQEIADGFLGNTSTQDIKKRTSIVRVVIIFATIITLIITAVYVSAWIDAHRENNGGHDEITIIDYGTIYVETTSSP